MYNKTIYEVNKPKYEILVRQVFYTGYTWDDLENLFCEARKDLKEKLYEFFATNSNDDDLDEWAKKVETFNAQIAINECNNKLINDNMKDF